MNDKSIIVGPKRSSTKSTLLDFEGMPKKKWEVVRNANAIPNNFMFLVGIVKYPKRHQVASLKFGKDYLFVQNMLPHNSDQQRYRTRGFGALYALYEPDGMLQEDPKNPFKGDAVLDESAIYLALPDNHIQLILRNGEHRIGNCVAEMFAFMRKQRGLLDFSPKNSKPRFYEVTFTTKSCGYFLKNRTYQVWASPIGIPDEQSGEVHKGWIFCDVNCGIPAIMRADRETFSPLPDSEGSKVGLFTVRNGNLNYEK